MSGTGRGPVELSAGCRLVLAGTQWQVDQFEPHTGRVLLRRDDGQELATTSGRWSTTATAGPSRLPPRACR